jgi:hypothetical protein
LQIKGDILTAQLDAAYEPGLNAGQEKDLHGTIGKLENVDQMKVFYHC